MNLPAMILIYFSSAILMPSLILILTYKRLRFVVFLTTTFWRSLTCRHIIQNCIWDSFFSILFVSLLRCFIIVLSFSLKFKYLWWCTTDVHIYWFWIQFFFFFFHKSFSFFKFSVRRQLFLLFRFYVFFNFVFSFHFLFFKAFETFVITCRSNVLI